MFLTGDKLHMKMTIFQFCQLFIKLTNAIIQYLDNKLNKSTDTVTCTNLVTIRFTEYITINAKWRQHGRARNH